MDYEKHEVKGYKKRYKNSKGKTRETISKSIYLGASTIFDAGDDVIIITEDDFTRLSASGDTNDDVDVDIGELENEVKLRDEKIDELENEVKLLLHEMNTTKNIILMLQNKESYLEKLILKYETYGLIDRIKKTNPKDTINISADYELLDSDDSDNDGS